MHGGIEGKNEEGKSEKAKDVYSKTTKAAQNHAEKGITGRNADTFDRNAANPM